MTPAQLHDYVALGMAALTIGRSLFDQIKLLWSQNGLTDDEINAIEAAMALESEKRQAERREMGKSD